MANAILKTLLLLMALLVMASARETSPSFRGLKKTNGKRTKCKEGKIELLYNELIPTRIWLTLCYESGRGAPYKAKGTISAWTIGMRESQDVTVEDGVWMEGSFNFNSIDFRIITARNSHGRIIATFWAQYYDERGRPTPHEDQSWIDITD